jgi:hypothetical protein
VDILREPWKVVADHGIESRIRQANGVHHAAIEFRYARSGSAFAWLWAYRFCDDSANRFEIHHASELSTVSRSSGCKNYRILKFNCCGRDGEKRR